MHRTLRRIATGAAAEAAGTTALNAVTYLDMAVRGRAANSTPTRTVERLSDDLGVPVPGDGSRRDNRLAGLGPLTGVATGVGVAALVAGLGAARLPLPIAAASLAVAAMGASDGMMTAVGVTEPRSWRPSSWAADVVPHLAYGAVTAGVLRATRSR